MQKANKIIMTIAGMLLITAGVLKAHQLMTQPINTEGFWESWLFFVIQIPLELGLGIWLVSGLFRKAGWLLATLAYGGFVVVTIIKGITGAASCGCFGTVTVNPWITLFVMDIPVFVLLIIFRPKGCKLLPPPWPSLWHFLGTALPTALLLPAVVLLLVTNKPPQKTDKYEVVDVNEWISPSKSKLSAPDKPEIPEVNVPEPNLTTDEPNIFSSETNNTNSTAIPEPNEPVREPKPNVTNEPTAEPNKIADESNAPLPEPGDTNTPSVSEPNETFREPESNTSEESAAEPNQTPKQGQKNQPEESEKENSLKSWPMAEHVNVMDKLETDVAVVYLYRYNCPNCREDIDEFERIVHQFAGNEQAIKFAYISVPPYPTPEQDLVPKGTPAVRGKLSDEKQWYFETPVIVILVDGKVANVWQGEVPGIEQLLNIISESY
jgi:thiol-disulfide isomerase/thioredoxin